MMPDVRASPPHPGAPAVGCVVLTRGGRDAELHAALASLRAQRGVEVDVVVVGNGWRPAGLPEGVRSVHLETNAGIPGGRNAGVGAVAGELLFFLDDDAELEGTEALARAAGLFAADPRLGLLQLRVEPMGGGRRLREWVPRWGDADPARSADVTAVWEGAVLIPRAVFERVGGWPAEFTSVHEGVDLAWRVMDGGLRVHYTADAVVRHPPPDAGAVPGRRPGWLYHGTRNRIWLARRYLPWPLGILFVGSFALRTLPGLRTRARLEEWGRGIRDGLREPCGPRRPLRRATLRRMTRLGRPPVL
jgi:GT2 family glycosyltransferase